MRTLSGGIRLLPAPPLEPPFDDELEPDASWPLPAEVGAQLALDWSQAGQPSPAPADTPPPEASPAVRSAVVRFLDRCLEIFNGHRPASHVLRMSAPVTAQTIIEQLAAVAQRTTRRHGGIRPGNRPGAVTCRRVLICEPRPGAVEAVAILAQASGRIWALAFRLEQRRNAWLCTAVTDVAPPPPPPSPPLRPTAPARSATSARSSTTPARPTTPARSPAPTRTTMPARAPAPARTTMPARAPAPARTTTPARAPAPARTTTSTRSAASTRTTTPAPAPAPARTTTPARSAIPGRSATSAESADSAQPATPARSAAPSRSTGQRREPPRS